MLRFISKIFNFLKDLRFQCGDAAVPEVFLCLECQGIEKRLTTPQSNLILQAG